MWSYVKLCQNLGQHSFLWGIKNLHGIQCWHPRNHRIDLRNSCFPSTFTFFWLGHLLSFQSRACSEAPCAAVASVHSSQDIAEKPCLQKKSKRLPRQCNWQGSQMKEQLHATKSQVGFLGECCWNQLQRCISSCHKAYGMAELETFWQHFDAPNDSIYLLRFCFLDE